MESLATNNKIVINRRRDKTNHLKLLAVRNNQNKAIPKDKTLIFLIVKVPKLKEISKEA